MGEAHGHDEMAWIPSESVRERSRLLAAMRRWGFGQDTSALLDLNRRAVADPEWFWREAAADLGVDFRSPYQQVLDESDGKQFPNWFTGGRINVAELAALRHGRGDLAGKTAVVYEADSGLRRALTYGELADEVQRFAAQLVELGVRRGDRVVLFMPVVPESVVAFLAIAMIGAVSVPTFSGYAPDALATRLQDSEAVLLVTADGTTRRGNTVDMKSVADEAVTRSPSVRSVIVIRHLGTPVPMQPGRDIYYDELPPAPTAVPTVDTESNEPLTIVYTSGTTGRPKGIVHSHGGFAVKTAVDFGYAFDVHAEDVVGWITDLGWLVGPMLMTGPLQLGATIVMIEGLPTHPTPTRMWDIVVRNQVTVQGIAPTGARALKAGGGLPPQMPSLRSFVSTGEAWDEPTWWWLFDEVGGRTRPIVNYSGGTEVGGGIVVGYPFLPAAPAAFSGPLPGVDATVLDETGKPVTQAIGELAVRNTFPGMTHAFWQDRDRYLETYWGTWEGIWVHGDLASVDSAGMWRIHGRSDDTLKLSGRRVGPAEIEAAILRDERIAEVAVIGVPDEARGQRAVAFAVLRGDEADHDDLAATAVTNAGKSFAPELYVVPTLPKTKNGKIMRRAIRSRFMGVQTGDMSSLDPATPLEDIPVYAGKE
ncbi:AMP-binding protein [Gordonia jinghuaiqii]|uniref:acetate--CoA ligase n=1 Tax=Gordonia jinghuaiqii TaxID=2758710 RepID=A0A7D7LWX5_9ACTN|nr:AMP-binding protein [Gordonia jinghuaiqii]MCR5980360.1 AMP-binding protein [Gordonia jinghuaiqii]QMT01899.1 AMP-binding protein [Gordonia jinghuaiqii]